VEVEGGRLPTADWILNLQILTSGGYQCAGFFDESEKECEALDYFSYPKSIQDYANSSVTGAQAARLSGSDH
jgi:hypothetical protein